MSTEEQKSIKKTKIPVVLYVIIPVSLYFIYQSYSRISMSDYFSGVFFLIVAVVLIVASYSTYKQHKNN